MCQIWEIDSPQSGWDIVNHAIAEYQILELDGGNDEKNLSISLTKATWIQFEIYHNGKYKYYDYLEPSYYRLVDFESKNVYSFLKLLQSEFKIPLYQTDDRMVLNPSR